MQTDMSMENARLVAAIDCTHDYSADEYFAHGEAGVVDAPAGADGLHRQKMPRARG